MTGEVSAELEIEGPLATCGHCRFTSALIGTWSVEDGRLVWRGDADVQPCRGPDLTSCCESSEIARFDRVVVTEGVQWQDRDLPGEDVAALRQSAKAAADAEMAAWHRERRQ